MFLPLSLRLSLTMASTGPHWTSFPNVSVPGLGTPRHTTPVPLPRPSFCSPPRPWEPCPAAQSPRCVGFPSSRRQLGLSRAVCGGGGVMGGPTWQFLGAAAKDWLRYSLTYMGSSLPGDILDWPEAADVGKGGGDEGTSPALEPRPMQRCHTGPPESHHLIDCACFSFPRMWLCNTTRAALAWSPSVLGERGGGGFSSTTGSLPRPFRSLVCSFVRSSVRPSVVCTRRVCSSG